MAVLKHLGETPKATMKNLTVVDSGEPENVPGMLWLEIEELFQSKAVPTKRQICTENRNEPFRSARASCVFSCAWQNHYAEYMAKPSELRRMRE